MRTMRRSFAFFHGCFLGCNLTLPSIELFVSVNSEVKCYSGCFAGGVWFIMMKCYRVNRSLKFVSSKNTIF